MGFFADGDEKEDGTDRNEEKQDGFIKSKNKRMMMQGQIRLIGRIKITEE